MPVTLEQLLLSREQRVQHQKDLLGAYPGKSLLCLTVQLPGAEKRTDISLKIAKAGVEAVRAAFSPDFEELKDLETGFEGYFILSMPPLQAKRLACQVEDTHPLGRLMDLDVCQMPGLTGHLLPLSRQDIGLPPRRCLLCDNEARYCMRARLHTQEELLARIKEMVEVACVND